MSVMLQMTSHQVDATPHPDVLLRPEYGVIFDKVGQLDNGIATWFQTFVLSLPSMVELQTSFPPLTTDLAGLSPLVQHQSLRIHLLNEDLNKLMIDIRNLLKNYNVTYKTDSRKKRALLPFIGSISRSLFNTATMDDINRIVKHIDAFESKEIHFNSGTTAILESMQSLIKNQDHRVQILERTLHKFTEYYSISAQNFTVNAVNLLGFYSLKYDTLLQLKINLIRLQTGIATLMQGYLSPHLISTTLIKHMIANITSYLQSNHSTFSLVHKDVRSYYHIQNIVFCVKGTQLYIMMKVPLSSLETRMNIYKVTTFSSPFPHLNNTGLQFDLVDMYFAINFDEKMYLELSMVDYLHCSGLQLKRCDNNLMIRNIVNNPSCLVAIYLDNLHLIKQLCNTVLLKHINPTPLTRVINLHNGSFVVSTTQSDWSMTCKDLLPTTIKPCLFCVLTLPCECAIHAHTFSILPHSFNCNFNNILTVNSLPNMPLLVNNDLIFESMANLNHVQSKINSLLSDFKILEHNFHSSLLSDQPIKLSLNKLLNQAKMKDRAYINDITALHASLGYLTDDRVSTSIPWLTYINFFLTMLITIFLFLKFGCVGLLITAPPAHALSIEQTLLSNFKLAEWFDIFIILLLLFGLITFLFFKNKRPCFATYLYITFFSDNNECTLFLRSTNLHVVPNGRLITHSTIPTFRLRLFLYINWQQISLVNSDVTICLPSRILLSPREYYHLRALLPNLKNVQIAAHASTSRNSLVSWVIPFAYPPNYIVSKYVNTSA
jgi:hypothetical protein